MACSAGPLLDLGAAATSWLCSNGPSALCVQSKETIDLLLGCSYSRETWFKVLWWVGWHQFSPVVGETFVEW
jgi:hypothetical protein